MAGTTPNLGLNKPSYEDRADVALLNANMDILDGFAENVQNSITAEYDKTSLYAIGATCVHNGKLKRCVSTISVAEEWNEDHWTDATVLDFVANGLELPEFTDLNGFTFGGVYYGLDTLISTYSHIPVSSGSFTLFVSNRVESNTTVCTQLLIASDSKQLWSRVSKINNGSIAWSDWENYLMASQVKNNLTTSDTGYVLDASQGKQLSTSIGHMQDGLAIVANGNTHGAISSGQYVYVKNHSSLAEGMYTASTNVAANDTLSTSNLTAVSNGGLNALNGNMTDISNRLFSPAYNANTDRSVDANRTAVMEHLLTNYFVHGYHFVMVRYASGYYHGYIYVGEYGGADTLFVEIPNNVDGKLVIWRRNNAGTYSKAVIS